MKAMKLVETHMNANTILATDEEIEEAIKKLKRKKAADEEGWKSEIILDGGSDLKSSFKLMMKELLKNKVVPKEWEKNKNQIPS